MSLQKIIRDMHSLTFSEMLELSKAVYDALDHSSREPHSLAEQLLKMEFRPGEADELAKQEERLLAKAFSRKRTISVVRNSGWSVEVGTLPGSHVRGITLRECFPKMLDQIITIEALNVR